MGNMRRVMSTPALCCKMEGAGGVLREMAEENLKECIYVYGKIIERRYQGPGGGVRIARPDGLINKEYIQIFGPGVRIAARIGASRCDSAGSELEEEAGCDSA